MRVALVGYGAVSAVHARGLKGHCDLEVVIGPEEEKARDFATAHGMARFGTDLAKGLRGVDAVIICSPSPVHYSQSVQALEAGVHTLIELPACSSMAEAAHLRELARAAGVQLHCAHTSRYLEPYLQIGEWIRSGAIGDVEHVVYTRSIAPRARSWRDDALLHHAEHPLDLALHWFGHLTPIGCAAHSGIPGAQNVSLLAAGPAGTPISISISYTGRIADTRMMVIGRRHTVATDGFSYIKSDDCEMNWNASADETYERAIADQDRDFIRACEAGEGGIAWEETMRLTAVIEEFTALWNQHSRSDL